MTEKKTTKTGENIVLNLTPDQAEYLRESISNYIDMMRATYVMKTLEIMDLRYKKEHVPEKFTETDAKRLEAIEEWPKLVDLAISRAWVIEILIYELLQLPLPERKSNEEDIAYYAKQLQDAYRADEQNAAVSEDSEVLSTESKE